MFEYFVSSVLTCTVFWSLFLRKSLFFCDHVVVLYPLRLFKRQVEIQYCDIDSFSYNGNPSNGDYLMIHPKSCGISKKMYVRWFCSSLVRTRKRKERMMPFYFFLKYLKGEGYLIKKNSDLQPMEERVELVFGTGVANYVRKTPSEKKEAHKKHIVDAIITYILISLLVVLFTLYYISLL